MRKLRRHDWRSQRNIECSICGDMLESRQEIVNHRQKIHRMFRKTPCRYFPECLDDNECLYDHKSSVNEETDLLGCPQGQNCANQDCTFSEKSHRSLNQTLCRFQWRCNRSACVFKHTVSRKSFFIRKPTKKEKNLAKKSVLKQN